MIEQYSTHNNDVSNELFEILINDCKMLDLILQAFGKNEEDNACLGYMVNNFMCTFIRSSTMS